MQYKNQIIEVTNAKPTGSGGFVGNCLSHEDSNASLSLKFTHGKKNPIVYCHAGCGFTQVVQSLSDKGLWASEGRKYEHFEKRFKSIIEESQDLEGTLGQSYLSKRGISSLDTNNYSNLRYHESLYHSDSKEFYPALLGVIKDEYNNTISVQRIFINNEAEKAKIKSGKKVTDSFKGGFVELGNDYVSGRIHLCEGIETGVALQSSLGERVLVTISANNLAKINLKGVNHFKEVHIWADNDKSKTGQNVGEEALKKYTKDGFKTYLHFPRKDPQNDQKSYDFLDQYCEFGAKSIEEDLKVFKTNELRAIQVPKYDLPSFDDSFLPKQIWDWVSLNSKKLNVPFELVAVPLITLIGGIIGRRVKIQPKKHDKSFEVFPNLWGMIIAPPGYKKSPAIKQSLQFVEKYERGQIQHRKQIIAENEPKISSLRIKLQKIEKEFRDTLEGKKDKNLSQEDYEKQRTDIFKQMKLYHPSVDRRLVNSATIEKIINMISENNLGTIVFRDELAGFFDQFLKSGHETDRQFYLESWSGDNSFHYDTVSRGEEYIENICISILGSTQPTVVKKLLNSTLSDSNDGLLQRFQLMVYPNDNIVPRFVDERYDYSKDEPIKELFQSLFNLEKKDDKNCFFSNDAYDLYKNYFQNLEEEVFNEKEEVFKSHLNKYNKLVPALSLIFHIMEQAMSENDTLVVSEKSIQFAIKWGDFLKAHARKVYDLDYSCKVVSGFALAEKIRDRKVLDGDSIRSIYKNGWKDLTDVNEVELSLSILEEHNWLSVEESKQKTGRPSSKILFNDGLLEFLQEGKWKK